MHIEDTSRNLIIIDSAVGFVTEKRREKTILKRFRLATLFSLIFLILLSPPILSGVAQSGDYHTDHLNDPTDAFPNDYAPMVIPVNGKSVTIAPVITCTTLVSGVFKPHHHPCKSAQTIFVDDDWSDKDANYTYLFEDWTDYDWNDIVVSLYTFTNDIIDVEIRLEDREAAWKNPFSVEITPEGLTVDVHWNSTDYPGEHIVKVNPDETVDIELLAESNPGDTAFITIIPIIPPVASFVYSPPYPQVCEDVTFNASASTPDGGYIVSYEWDFGDCCLHEFGMVVTHHYTTTGTYNVTLNVTDSEGKWDTESKMITVTPRTYTLTITSTAGGTTDPVPDSYSHNEGTVVPVTAISDSGCVFDHWKLDGVDVGSANPIDVTMDDDHTLHAVFTEIICTLTITATTGGTTDPAPGAHGYGSGSTATVTAIPDPDYYFDHWMLNGSSAGSTNPIYILMNSDHDLEAVFTQITHALTITTTAGGTTSPVPGDHVYSSGTNVPVTATPQDGYQFDHWELDSVNVGSSNPYTVTMDADHTLHAVFELVVPTYTLTITSTTGGATNPSPGAYSYEEGTVVSVKANPSTGYVFDHWVLDGSNAGSDNLISVTMNKNHTLHAVFKEETAPPSPVGGHAIPIDKSRLLAPKSGLTSGIGLASVLLAAMAATIILIRRRNKTLK